MSCRHAQNRGQLDNGGSSEKRAQNRMVGPHSGPHISQPFPMFRAMPSLPSEPQAEYRGWCWELSPRKDSAASEQQDPAAEARAQDSSSSICFVCFPDRQKEKRDVEWKTQWGKQLWGWARLEAGGSHSSTYSTRTASAPRSKRPRPGLDGISRSPAPN